MSLYDVEIEKSVQQKSLNIYEKQQEMFTYLVNLENNHLKLEILEYVKLCFDKMFTVVKLINKVN